MSEMELKEIKVESILANFYQPRTKFDKEGIKELAESILSNGLINPITVSPDKKREGKFMIVSGEKRWQAHKVANIKTIPCVVKEYKTDGQFMVESLIENIHREDLTPTEKGKFCLKIMKEDKIKSITELAERINSNRKNVDRWIDDVKTRKRLGLQSQTDFWTIQSTRGLEDKERKKLIEYAEKKKVTCTVKRESISYNHPRNSRTSRETKNRINQTSK